MKMYSSASEKLASRNSKESLMMLSLQPLNIDKVIGITWRPNTNKWWRDIAAPTSLLMLLYCSLSGWIQQQSRRDANDSKSPAKTDACLCSATYAAWEYSMSSSIWFWLVIAQAHPSSVVTPLAGLSLKFEILDFFFTFRNGDNCLWRTTCERDAERCSADGNIMLSRCCWQVQKHFVSLFISTGSCGSQEAKGLWTFSLVIL